MMGHYYYYIDLPGDHECMWSGECCLISQVAGDETPVSSKLALPPASIKLALQPASITSSDEARVSAAAEAEAATTEASQEPQQEEQQEQPQEDEKEEDLNQPAATVVVSNTAPKVKSHKAKSKSALLAANKKLRHREVEKNRHRQLQAMVKSLSERIPGRSDRETQVQTMKRAARYSLYLRDAMRALPHGQAQLSKVYRKAWDTVEHMDQAPRYTCESP